MADRKKAAKESANAPVTEGERIARGLTQESRLERLWKEVRRREHGDEIDVIVLPNHGLGMSPSFRYATGFTNGRFEGSFLIITESKVTLITDRIEAEAAGLQRWPGMEILAPEGRHEALKELSDRISGKVTGFDGVSLSASYLRALVHYHSPKSIRDVAPEFISARQVKDLTEIGQIMKATFIAKRTLRRVPELMRPGISELELAAELDYAASRLGSHGPAFPSVVAFGANTTQPHHISGETRLRQGSPVLVDYGATFLGYSSDVTRSYLFRPRSADGKTAKRFEEMFRIVTEAQADLVAKMMPGVRGGAVYAAGKRHLDSAARGRYADTLIHALGHTVGIEPHDGTEPLSKNSRIRLRREMVIAVEPGVTIKGEIGVRKGDIAVVKEEGAQII